MFTSFVDVCNGGKQTYMMLMARSAAPTVLKTKFHGDQQAYAMLMARSAAPMVLKTSYVEGDQQRCTLMARSAAPLVLKTTMVNSTTGTEDLSRFHAVSHRHCVTCGGAGSCVSRNSAQAPLASPGDSFPV